MKAFTIEITRSCTSISYFFVSPNSLKLPYILHVINNAYGSMIFLVCIVKLC